MIPFTPAECEAIALALRDHFLGVDAADDLDDEGRGHYAAAQSALAKLPSIAQGA
jgi:hypothetical protein